MSVLGNIIWLIFGGFLSGLGYILGGLGLCITIVGIPFGVQAIKIGLATFAFAVGALLVVHIPQPARTSGG